MMQATLIYLICLFNYSLQRSTPQDDHYIAAVVEYEVNRIVEENLVKYEQFIAEAAQQNADIVVFPELTLTNSSISFAVPFHGLLQDYPIPALYPELYHELLVAISAAARQHDIYVVFNTRELMNCTNNDTGEECPEPRVYIFNTNVVIDRTGAVIDRYRKINLFGEFFHTPALHPDLGVFTTDFGVTFGHFICFDLQFQVPSIQILQKHQLTNIIFTTMWYSELPYLNAIQLTEAYAYAMNVNFLASGANRPAVGSAGSGIFSGKAGALVSIMPGVPTTRLLVAKVPKVPGQVTEPVPGPIYNHPSEQDGLFLLIDPSLPSHVSRELMDGSNEFVLVDKDVSCTFRVKLNHSLGKYKYRAAAFSGVRTYSGLATGGTRVCSVIACVGDTINSCGTRFNTYTAGATAVFEELSIFATFPTPVSDPNLNANDSAVFPVTSKTSIMPLEPEGYNYDVFINGNWTHYNFTLNNFDEELYSFAVWGRDFTTDGQEADPPREDMTTVPDETTTVTSISPEDTTTSSDDVTTVPDEGTTVTSHEDTTTSSDDLTTVTTATTQVPDNDGSYSHKTSYRLLLSMMALVLYGYL